MTYSVTISDKDFQETFTCAGPNDQVALIYAGKVVEINADRSKPDALVVIKKDGTPIGPQARVREMITRAI